MAGFGFLAPSRLCGGEGEPGRAKDGADAEVDENSLEIKPFEVLTYPEEPELAPCWAAELAREGQDEEKGFNGGRWV
jgi:hypothetical protein